MAVVHFVGAGPGDAGMLTVRGADLLGRADVVAHEPGAPPGVLERAGPQATRLPLERGAGASLVEAARGAGQVVRLLAGDVRGSAAVRREAASLRRAGIDFELVAGVAVEEAARREPLLGRTVVVTRARAQAAELVEALEALGADVVCFAAIRTAPPADPEPLRRAVRQLEQYDWVVFTSVNGVDRFWQALEATGLDARALGGRQVAAIGPATAEALYHRGIRADVVPEKYVAESVLDALADTAGLDGARILLPGAAEARDVLPKGLAERGARVDDVEAYRTVPDAAGAAELHARLDAGEVDVLTFTASSTVRSFVEAVGPAVGAAQVATIGPVTTETARELGMPVDIEAEVHTIPGLVEAIDRAFSARSDPSDPPSQAPDLSA